MDDTLFLALSIVVSINVVLFIGQASLIELAPEVNVPSGTFYDARGSLLCAVDSNNCNESSSYVLNSTEPTQNLPDTTVIESGDGNFFTDMFSSIKTYFSNSPLGYLMDIVSAPYTFLSIMGLPPAITFALGGLWYLITFMLLLAFLWGR